MAKNYVQPGLFPLPNPSSLTVGEIWNQASEDLLSRLAEDRRIERKPAGIHWKELAEYFSMWANTVDGGLIVIGMEDDGIFSGFTDKGVEHANRLETNARTYCPDARIDVRRLSGAKTSDRCNHASAGSYSIDV